MSEMYYVLRENNIPKRVAKFNDAIVYGWEKDKWVKMPGLAKILWDVTDYEKISRQQAEKLIKWQSQNWDKVVEK